MIGLGTQDTYEQAKVFSLRHQITFRMLWDSGFTSWQGFGISRQPAAILVTRDGTKVQKWQGELSDSDKAEIARLAKET